MIKIESNSKSIMGEMIEEKLIGVREREKERKKERKKEKKGPVLLAASFPISTACCRPSADKGGSFTLFGFEMACQAGMPIS